MATLDGFLDLIWRERLSAENRELVREALRLLDELEGEQRVKLLAAFFWANWCRGRAEARHEQALAEYRLKYPPSGNQL
ncbi:MAG: hypothetical protein L3K11_06280 [Thermoplasmata archaeon]|nr:hypothetical protein [Thermoplasmata archaeon]